MRRTPGDSCNVPAGTMHEEHTEAEGARYVAEQQLREMVNLG